MVRLRITSAPGATEGQRWAEIEREAERLGYWGRVEFDRVHPGGVMVSTWRKAGDQAGQRLEITSTSAPVGGYIVKRRERWFLPDPVTVTTYAAGKPLDERGLMKWVDDLKQVKVYETMDQARAVAKVYRGKVVRYADEISGQTILADGAPTV